MKGSITISPEVCKGCELCISFCPKGVIKLSDKPNTAGYCHALYLENGECTGCAVCAIVCPEVAIEVYRA